MWLSCVKIGFLREKGIFQIKMALLYVFSEFFQLNPTFFGFFQTNSLEHQFFLHPRRKIEGKQLADEQRDSDFP